MAAPASTIVGFHRDEEGHWVAELACGHPQHVRHRPPWEDRAWVTTPEGRAERIGAALPCTLCRMPRVPPGAQEHKRTPVFDAATTPAGLKRSHTTKAGVWGEIVVVEGQVHYVVEGDEEETFVLRPGVSGGIAPEAPHHVEPQPGARFFVRFLRPDAP